MFPPHNLSVEIVAFSNYLLWLWLLPMRRLQTPWLKVNSTWNSTDTSRCLQSNHVPTEIPSPSGVHYSQILYPGSFFLLCDSLPHRRFRGSFLISTSAAMPRGKLGNNIVLPAACVKNIHKKELHWRMRNTWWFRLKSKGSLLSGAWWSRAKKSREQIKKYEIWGHGVYIIHTTVWQSVICSQKLKSENANAWEFSSARMAESWQSANPGVSAELE